MCRFVTGVAHALAAACSNSQRGHELPTFTDAVEVSARGFVSGLDVGCFVVRQLDHAHPGPVDVEFFGNEHGQGGEHALADFATRCADDDAIVALDHDVAGEFHQILANEFDLGRGSGKRGFAKAHQQGTARGEAKLQEATS